MSKENRRIPLVRYEWPDERREKRAKRTRLALYVLALALAFGLGFGSARAVLPSVVELENSNSSLNVSRLEAIYNILNREWYFGKFVDDLSTTLIDNAIEGMIRGTDDVYTEYLSAQQVTDFAQGIDRGFVGIGVSFYDNNGSYIVERVFISSPAEAAGVQPGDIIFRVDGVEVTGIGTDTLVSMVRGERDTVVVIDFLRGQDVVRKEITRGLIRNTAFGKMMDSKTALLEIYQFGTSTANEVAQYLQLFQTNNAQNIIIDLRDNGGGFLSSLEEVSSLFMPRGAVLIQQELIDGTRLRSESRGLVVMSFNQVVILINQNSASAAEVFSAAAQEHLNATLVGVTTFGKGTVQQQYAFSDGSALKYTVAQWLTPSGQAINGVGIEPDIRVTQHHVLKHSFTQLEEDETIAVDTVHPSVQDIQMGLDFLGYAVDRQDSYFSQVTEAALKAYQADQGLEPTGLITAKLSSDLRAEVVRVWFIERATRDEQMKAALAFLNE
jgi:carboxyl-terminal processing protease